MAEPTIDRPGIPPEYGLAKATAFVPWEHVEDRLRDARMYWIATVTPAGRPRVRPIDGVYLDRALYVGGSPETSWVQDIGPAGPVSVHLEGPTDIVIVEGAATVRRAVHAPLAERLAMASNAKYPEYGMTAAFYRENGAIEIGIRKVVAWTDISRDPTRFTF
jgi:hypothetical protein